MIRRPAALFASVIAAFVPSPSLAVEAFTSNIPPFSIETGARAGFVREIVVEMAKRVGADVPIVFGKSWPQSQEDAKTRVDTIIFPLARTGSREAQYQWIQKILDMDVAFATAPGKPAAGDEATTRALARVGVRDGSPMVKELKDRGYANLVVLKTSAENVRALYEGKIDAWYAPAPEIAFNWVEQKLPGSPVFGLKLQTVPLYIAASRNTPGIDFEKWRKAYATIEQDGTRTRILATYGLK
ncbi:MAG: transporter substrate-binding domain-containing protein [Rhizobiales bacterium]|nr:transporter substrate-binding domain-containing protein [Hyphomicrobiales bacterium]